MNPRIRKTPRKRGSIYLLPSLAGKACFCQQEPKQRPEFIECVVVSKFFSDFFVKAYRIYTSRFATNRKPIIEGDIAKGYGGFGKYGVIGGLNTREDLFFRDFLAGQSIDTFFKIIHGNSPMECNSQMAEDSIPQIKKPGNEKVNRKGLQKGGLYLSTIFRSDCPIAITCKERILMMRNNNMEVSKCLLTSVSTKHPTLSSRRSFSDFGASTRNLQSKQSCATHPAAMVDGTSVLLSVKSRGFIRWNAQADTRPKADKLTPFWGISEYCYWLYSWIRVTGITLTTKVFHPWGRCA